MSVLMADYDAARAAFENLFHGNCQHPILLYCGMTGGTGKTALLTFCRERAPEGVSVCPIQLRASTVGVAEIFYRCGDAVKWNRFPAFTDQVARMQNGANVRVEGNSLMGMHNSISVALQAETAIDREYRGALLASNWFEDLARFGQRIVFLFDTYDHATTDVKNWISGPFLSRAAHTAPVRVVIGGRQVPDRNNIEWGSRCVQHDLSGVEDAEHWMPVIQGMGKSIDHLPYGWLAGVCYALKGNPGEIMKIISRLPLACGQ
jgi:hypothetical protein